LRVRRYKSKTRTQPATACSLQLLCRGCGRRGRRQGVDRDDARTFMMTLSVSSPRSTNLTAYLAWLGTWRYRCTVPKLPRPSGLMCSHASPKQMPDIFPDILDPALRLNGFSLLPAARCNRLCGVMTETEEGCGSVGGRLLHVPLYHSRQRRCVAARHTGKHRGSGDTTGWRTHRTRRRC